MLTPEELAEIEARANAATSGPYEPQWDDCDCSDEPCGHGQFVYALRLPVVHTTRPNGVTRDYDFEYHGVDDFTPETAVFLAKAREDVPALVAEVKQLRAERDEALAKLVEAEHDRDRARDAAVALEQEIAQIRALHHSPHGELCVECCEDWPCPTIQILDGGEDR